MAREYPDWYPEDLVAEEDRRRADWDEGEEIGREYVRNRFHCCLEEDLEEFDGQTEAVDIARSNDGDMLRANAIYEGMIKEVEKLLKGF